MNKTNTIEELKEVRQFLDDCFQRLDDKVYWLNAMDLLDSQKGFILKGLTK